MPIFAPSDDALVLTPDGRRRTMAVYGAAHFGKSLFWYAGEIVCAYYLTEVAGLTGLAMGLVIGFGLLVGALLDPLTDLIFARRLATAYGAATLQMLGACLSALAFTAMFVAGAVPASGRLSFVLATAIAFRLAYALYDQPQNALLGLATITSRDRTVVAALRLALSAVAALVIAAIVAALAFGGSSHVDSADPRFAIVGIALSICAVGSAALLYRARGAPHPSAKDQRAREIYWAMPPEACWLPLGLALASAATVSIFTKAQPYLVRYALDSVILGTLIGSGVPLGGMLSQPVWAALSRNRSRHRIVRLACLILIGASASFWMIASVSPIAAIAAAFLIGVGSGGIAIMMWATFGDAVTRPAGQPGWNFGLLTGTMKVGLAIGALSFGILLDATHVANTQGASLVAIMAIGPMLGGCCCMILAAYSSQTFRLAVV